MNQYQKVIVTVAVANVFLTLMFPPFQDISLIRGAMHSFDSFLPLYWAFESRQIHRELLSLELIFVVTNALAAWLVMQHSGERRDRPVHFLQGLLIFGAVNFALIFSFPPFEQYSSLVRIEIPRFDGFYFLLGDKMHRHIFVPLLYIESILIAVNLLLMFLLFNVVQRSLSASDAHLLELAHALPPEKIAALSETLESELRAQVDEPRRQNRADRRRFPDPNYRGPERRSGIERRKRPREMRA